MPGLRSTGRKVLVFHRWFMKYSGTTMIIDNVEERRLMHKSEESSEEDYSNRNRGDADSDVDTLH